LARDDDYFLGVLHSKVHEVWSLHKAARHGVGNDPTYNVSTCFMTFPFPWPPSQEPAESEDERVFAIAQAARELNSLREEWLNPPPPNGMDITYTKMLNKRTLTNLYNVLTHYRQEVKDKKHNPAQWEKEVDGIISLEQIQELDTIHTTLNRAVLAAYGWPAALSDEQILERLLALNLERAKG
jgi:type II restriction/modification system DNA methylase subunit YeeA